MSKPDIERRYVTAELRMEGDNTPTPKVVGYASVFNSMSDDLGGFREIVRPHAFQRSLLSNPDVIFWAEHGVGGHLPLARTTNGSLQLREDQRGLRFEATLDPTDDDAKRLITKMRSGLMRTCSFAFNVQKDQWRTENAQEIRELHDVDLFDCSVVSRPAYPAADAALRSLNHWRETHRETTPEAVAENMDLLRMQLDLASID